MNKDDINTNGFLNDLNNNEDFNEIIEIDGNQYRVPYRKVKEITINVDKKDLIDMPHSTRLQYRLLLNDAILRARVEFIKGKITIVYNPTDAVNRKPKISRDEIIKILNENGVKVEKDKIEERDLDYVEEIYKKQFEPQQIRESVPYGYTKEEWKKYKDAFWSKVDKNNKSKLESFKEWQKYYESQHPDIFNTIKEKIKLKKGSNGKGFWFHGI